MIEQLAISLDQMQEKPAAVTLLDALERNSTQFEQFDEIAKSYFKIKEYEKAYTTAEKALALYSGPSSYAVKYNTLNTANHANYPERAMTLIKQLEIINPDDTDLQMEKAFAFFLLNQKDQAEKILRQQLANPRNDEKTRTKIRFNLGTYELLRDEFQAGLRKFLFEGRKLDYWKKPEFAFERWEGQSCPNRTIYVRSEAGIGDEFINIRFATHLAKIGMKPIWYTERKEMAEIFRRCGFDAVFEVDQINLNQNPTWVHSMDLPVYLNLEYADLWHGPYINAKSSSSHIKKSHKPKIGIRWQGNPSYDQDLHRSIPFDEMFDAVAHLDADIYSLQRDTGLEELAGYEDKITRLDMHMNSYEDTLSMIGDLDLVITSCTSIAHAAAAMGKETIVITPISAYYTWCHSTEKSPWYGNNLTILRQEKPRSWSEPLNKLKEIVDEQFNNR
jgi:hypothetical protein